MTTMDVFAEIKSLYYSATRATIQQDLTRAIDLLKTLPTEEERERVAVYMDGLSQMRSEWSATGPVRPSSAPRSATVRGGSDRSKGSGRRDR
jgi:hypothetical protein